MPMRSDSYHQITLQVSAAEGADHASWYITQSRHKKGHVSADVLARGLVEEAVLPLDDDDLVSVLLDALRQACEHLGLDHAW